MLVYGCQGNGLLLKSVSEADTGIYSCYLDNFVQPIVSYKFSLMVEGIDRLMDMFDLAEQIIRPILRDFLVIVALPYFT